MEDFDEALSARLASPGSGVFAAAEMQLAISGEVVAGGVNPFTSPGDGSLSPRCHGGASEARVSVCAMYAPNRLLELLSMVTATIHK